LNTKTLAAAVSLLDGVCVAVGGAYWRDAFGISAGHASSNFVLLALGIVMILDSAVCFTGVLEAYYASVVLALVALLGVVTWGAHLGSAGFLVLLLLSVLTVALDALGARRKTHVPEEDHPLNLPVFG
jgi:hypothetical protein